MSLKKNILYSGFLTTSIYVFQFITYPYIARVLGVTNIGICNYVQSIVNYFNLFAVLGISILGVREIAKSKDNKQKLNEIFSKLFLLNACFTFSVLMIYFISINCISQFSEHKHLLYIGASQILFNLFSVEWLFRGLENFKYITIRTMIVRTLYVVCVFIFVHKSSDYFVYFVIYSGMIFANAVINWNYSRKFVKLSFQSFSGIKQYVKPFIYLGSQLVLISFYTTFNTVYLGCTCSEEQVGYYSTATKIENIILALYSSFTIVMMPRISAMIENNDIDNVKLKMSQSFDLLYAFVFPSILFVEFYAEEIVYLVAGPGVEGAIIPMRIVMPLMLIVGIEQILIVQILTPMRKDKQVFINSLLGAICSIVLNMFIVPSLESIGSSIVWMSCEFVVLLSAYIFVKRYFPELNFVRKTIFHAVVFAPLILCFFAFSKFTQNQWLAFVSCLFVTIFYAHIALRYVVKNISYIVFTNSVFKRILHK